MTINRSTLLDLPLPVTGTEDGTWGDVTNNGLTEYLDIAIAGMTSLTSSDFTANELTLALTEGTNTATNIVGSSAQYSAIRVSSLAANSTITAPSSNRAYKVINADSTYSLTVKASGQTGVTFLPGTAGWVAFNGTDYFILGVVGPASATDNAVARFDGTTGKIVQNSAVTIADTSGNITGGTYNKVTITAPATGSTLTIADGKTLTANNSLTLGGTDATTMTFPSTSATIARTDAAQTFTGAQTFSTAIATGSGGTGQSTYSNGQLLIGKTDGTLAKATLTAGSNVTITNGDGTIEIASTGGGGGGGGTSVTVTQATATASQTTFNVTYTVGQLSVYLNGALLASADYTATNGTTVVLAAGAAANDIFTAVAYSTVAGLDIESASPFMTAVGSGAGAVNTGVNNVFVGFEAGNDNTTGTNNTAVGYQALDVNTTGASNTALGSGALGANTAGANNVAVGLSALVTNTTGNSNVAVGREALTTHNTASGSCVAVGYRALYLNSTGISNTAVGTSCMWNNTANNNTAVGDSAMFANTTGANNVAVGYQALDANTTGGYNTAVGVNALGANTTASQNNAFGYNALAANTTGNALSAFGDFCLDANTTGSANVGMGQNALGANTTGSNNTAIGASALLANTTGANNTAVGYQALDANTTGASNVAVGSAALGANTTGASNTAVGTAAMASGTTGSDNACFGKNAGENMTTGSNNTLIGSNAGQGLAALTTGSNNVMIGINSYATAGAVNQIVIGTDICVGQGDNYFTFGKTGNRVYNQYTVDANWARTSDGRLKRNVNDMSLGLSFVNKLRPVSYQWKPSYEVPQELVTQYNEQNKMDLDVVMHGFIAQEVKAALDEVGSTYTCGVWSEGSDGTQSISREMFIMPLVKAVQELSAKCDALQAEINTLKGN